MARTDNLDVPRITELFQELQFRTLTSRLENLLNKGVIGSEEQLALFGEEPVKLGLPPRYELDTTVVDTVEKLNQLVDVLKKAKQISFDTETTSTDPMRADLVGISLATEIGSAYYIPVGHVGNSPQLPVEQIVDAIRPAFSRPGYPQDWP